MNVLTIGILVIKKPFSQIWMLPIFIFINFREEKQANTLKKRAMGEGGGGGESSKDFLIIIFFKNIIYRVNQVCLCPLWNFRHNLY